MEDGHKRDTVLQVMMNGSTRIDSIDQRKIPRSPSWEYGFAVGVVALSTGVCFLIFPFFTLTNLVMIYLLGTLIVASRGTRGPAALSSALGVLCFDFFFVPPRYTLGVSDAQYVFTFIVMFSTAMVISYLTVRLRSEARDAREGQRTTEMMHEFSQRLSSARGMDDVLRVAIAHISQAIRLDVLALAPDQEGHFNLKATAGGPGELNEKDHAVAHWVYDTGQPAGLGTDSLPQSNALFVPIPGTRAILGVLCVRPRADESLGVSQKKVLESFAHQIGMALDVGRLQEDARKAELEVETERLRSSLLSSVSHDFRTPLTAIVGSASALIDKEEIRKGPKGLELLETIQSEGERLSRLVQNLLETTRLESGRVHLQKELYPLEEIVGSALERLEKSLQGRDVTVNIPEEFPAIPLDGILMEQVFINLFENAIRHTPPTSPIEVSAHADQEKATISVADRGPGLRDGEFERVFEKFFHDKASPGAGLGLAICRAIVNAHGGKIWAENRQGGGAVFRFSLPVN